MFSISHLFSKLAQLWPANLSSIQCIKFDGFDRYTTTIGDFDFRLDDPHDSKNGLVHSVVKFKGVAVDRQQSHPSHVSMHMRFDAGKIFKNQYDRLNGLNQAGFERVIDQNSRQTPSFRAGRIATSAVADNFCT